MATKLKSANRALLIVRTPFQTWLALKVLQQEEASNVDALYLTQNNSPEDRHYFKLLSQNTSTAHYIYVRPQRFDVLSHVLFRFKTNKWFRAKGYQKVLFASINAWVPNALACKHSQSEVITFDDGAANIVGNGIFYTEASGKRASFYQRLFGAKPLSVIKQRVAKHYTIYPSRPNIVPAEKLYYLPSWQASRCNANLPVKTYFIGTPFNEIMSQEQIATLSQFAKNLTIDTYVPHPREQNTLDVGAKKVLEKNGRIAEDAIIKDAGENPIALVGWFSTVMLNLEHVTQSRTVLLAKDAPNSQAIAKLSREADCKTVLI